MSYNEITGDKLKSKTGNLDSFNKGFDAIDWADKGVPKEQEDEPTKVDVPYHWVAGWQQGDLAL